MDFTNFPQIGQNGFTLLKSFGYAELGLKFFVNNISISFSHWSIENGLKILGGMILGWAIVYWGWK